MKDAWSKVKSQPKFNVISFAIVLVLVIASGSYLVVAVSHRQSQPVLPVKISLEELKLLPQQKQSKSKQIFLPKTQLLTLWSM